MRITVIIFFLSFLLVGTVANAQLKGFSIGPYVERAWTAGSSGDQLKNGLGAGLSADIKIPGNLGLTGSAGFLHFAGRKSQTESGEVRHPAINAFPLRGGIKFRPLPLIYIKMEAGVAKYSKQSAFLLSPGIGIRVLGIDIQGKYERWYDVAGTRFWGLRAGLNL
ncbi:MAG: hypothetical protein ABWZ25_03435 [Chitinophagaceae bacterium]